MALRMTFGRYYPASSPVHRLDARAKAMCTLALMVCDLVVATPAQLALSCFVTCGILAASRVPVGKVLASMRPVVALFVFTGLFNLFWVHGGEVLVALGPVTVSSGGLWAAILYTVRFVLLVCMGSLLTLTTPPTQLTDAFDSLLSPLGRLGAPTHEWSMVLSLALRFVPTLADDASAIMDAQAARASSLAEGGALERLRAFASILVPLFATSIRHAEGLGRALDARCYEGGAARTHWHEPHLGTNDAVAIALVAAFAAALVALGLLG